MTGIKTLRGENRKWVKYRIQLWTILFVVLGNALPLSNSLAESNPPEVRICSQNLFRYGETSQRQKSNPEQRDKQRSFLVSRMVRAKCDIIALQEVVGKNKKEANRTLDSLRYELELRSSRRFLSYVGESYDAYIRNGFFIAADLGKPKFFESYEREILPRLQPAAAPSRFLRAPVAVLVNILGKEGRPSRDVYVLNIHLKSKSMGYKDPTGTGFEHTRMEMAEGLRDLFYREAERLGPEAILLLLGDRNSGIDAPSAEILSGIRELEDFRHQGPCKLNEYVEPVCETAPRDERLLPLFALRQKLFPGKYPNGSYIYKGKQELLDEIYLRPRDVEVLRRPGGQLSLGMEGEFFKGSDHKLVWAELNW